MGDAGQVVDPTGASGLMLARRDVRPEPTSVPATSKPTKGCLELTRPSRLSDYFSPFAAFRCAVTVGIISDASRLRAGSSPDAA